MANENKPATEAQAPEVPAIAEGAQKLAWQTILLKNSSLIMLAVLIIVSAFMSPYFFTFTNLVNLTRQQTNYTIITMGLLVSMAAGGVDLSLAACMGVGAICMTQFIQVVGWSVPMAILGALFVSTAIGAINGYLIAYVGMPAFVVTLCMNFNLTGWAYIVTRGVNRQLTPAPGTVVSGWLKAYLSFGQNNDPILGIPMKFEFAFILVLLTWFVMTRTKFGRLMLATGSNPIASRLAGIDIRRYKLTGHCIASFGSGLTGVVNCAATASSGATVGAGDYTMIAMAAAIIGGSTLEGGGGNVPYTLVGIFVMGMINNIMNLANIAAYPQYIVKAAVIVISIYLRSVIDKRT